ncbi:MAG: hypothetical protein AKCLJLPJ_02077 [Fimbriimonadales bacterium]|nr:hypothetical protein [Fimbriimonadales bacterium]
MDKPGGKEEIARAGPVPPFMDSWAAFAVYYDRAQFFIMMYDMPGFTAPARAHLLAAAIHASNAAADEAAKQLGVVAEDDTPTPLQLARAFAPGSLELEELARREREAIAKIREKFMSLPRRDLIDKLRNADLHAFPLLPAYPGDRASWMITGNTRPLKVSADRNTTVTLGLTIGSAAPNVRVTGPGGKPGKRKDPKYGDTVSFAVRDGKHFTKHFSKGAEHDVEISEAIREFLNALGEFKRTYVPYPMSEPHDSNS